MSTPNYDLGASFSAQGALFTGANRVIPAGNYLAKIAATEVSLTQDKKGGFLRLDYEVIAGPETGALVTERLNLWNENARAVDIAQRRLRTIMQCVGVSDIQFSNVLHNKTLQIKVSEETTKLPAKPNDPDPAKREPKEQQINVVNGYMDLNSQDVGKSSVVANQPSAQQSAPPPPPPPAPSAPVMQNNLPTQSSSMPWAQAAQAAQSTNPAAVPQLQMPPNNWPPQQQTPQQPPAWTAAAPAQSQAGPWAQAPQQ